MSLKGRRRCSLSQKSADEMQEKLLAEDLWLSYFNRYLFEKAVITEKEFNRMTEKISLRRSECLLRRAMQ